MAIEIKYKTIPAMKVAYVPHTDSFSKVPQFIEEVGELIKENGFEATGLVYGTYDNGLQEFAEDKQIFEVGMAIKKFEIEGKPAGRIGKLGLKEITEHNVLAYRLKGSRENYNEIIRQMVDYALENKYDIVGPITEIYLPAFEDSPEQESETEIQLPVIYMGD